MTYPPPTLRWEGDVGGFLVLLDQTRLPAEAVELECRTVEDVWHAIRRLAVRGAPAIGVAAAYGVCVAASQSADDALGACDYLATSRPTAVNLFWALDRMRKRVSASPAVPDSGALKAALLAEARAIHAEDAAMCAAIGSRGADLLADLPVGAGILTHCNAGALATGGDGTALSVIFELARRDRRPHVWVDETRPLLQGARLTAWELMQRGIDCTLICDSMAASVMQKGKIQTVVVGADRIAANGDAANKIGTYGVAVLAKAHGIPFYVAAPTSTIDLRTPAGSEILIEERAAAEVTNPNGSKASIAPAGVAVYNPAFDVTPADLITAMVTDRGVARPVNRDSLRKIVSGV